jgi:hypothetical protein
LVTDESAFSKGIGFLGQVGSKLGQILKAGTVLAGAGLGLGVAMAKVVAEQAKVPVTALQAGLTVEDYLAWSKAVGIAGLSSDSFMSSLKSMNDEMKDIGVTKGNFPEELAMALQKLDVSPEKFMKTTSDQRLKWVFDAANKMPDRLKASLLVQKTLGDEARKYYDWMNLTGETYQSMLGRARGVTYITSEDTEKAMRFTKELNTLSETMKSAKDVFSVTFMDAFTPSLEALNLFMRAHKDEITNTLKEWAGAAANFVKELGAIGPKLIQFGTDVKTWAEGVKDFWKRMTTWDPGEPVGKTGNEPGSIISPLTTVPKDKSTGPVAMPEIDPGKIVPGKLVPLPESKIVPQKTPAPAYGSFQERLEQNPIGRHPIHVEVQINNSSGNPIDAAAKLEQAPGGGRF